MLAVFSRRRIFLIASLIPLWVYTPASASAHGFGESYDLPVPLNFFVVGSAMAVALSFVVIGLFVRQRGQDFRYSTYDLLRSPLIGIVLSNRSFLFFIKVAVALLLLLIVAAGLFGVNKPLENISPAMVWVIWWIGLGYISAFFGNCWALINPWKTLYEWAERLFLGRRDGRVSVLWEYPSRWDVWPAFVLFGVFTWLENVYSKAAIPLNLSFLIVCYSLITWVGMAVYGKHVWLRRGEAFAILFGFFARLSPTEIRVVNRSVCERCSADCCVEAEDCVDCYECFEVAEPGDRQLNLRPFAVGLTRSEHISTATAGFVVLVLATVTFDGFMETTFWLDVQNAIYPVASILGVFTVGGIKTVGLVTIPAVFILAYGLTSWAIQKMSGGEYSIVGIAKMFVFALVPIAVAYNIAHYVSFLLIQGQLVIPLASDPFGFGWDIFGTGDYRINIKIINARVVWYLAVAAIVLGHIISVYVAHRISVRTMGNYSAALRSQYPMMILMVAYTATSLWIIAQPIVNGG